MHRRGACIMEIRGSQGVHHRLDGAVLTARGLTYDPTGTGKTVFRFGGSMVYDLVCFFMGQNMNVNAPFSVIVQSTTVGQPLSLAAPWTNGSVIGNPFPRPAVPSRTIAFPKVIDVHHPREPISIRRL